MRPLHLRERFKCAPWRHSLNAFLVLLRRQFLAPRSILLMEGLCSRLGWSLGSTRWRGRACGERSGRYPRSCTRCRWLPVASFWRRPVSWPSRRCPLPPSSVACSADYMPWASRHASGLEMTPQTLCQLLNTEMPPKKPTLHVGRACRPEASCRRVEIGVTSNASPARAVESGVTLLTCNLPIASVKQRPLRIILSLSADLKTFVMLI